MRCSTYGVRPILKQLLMRVNRPKKSGFITLGIPNKGYDLHEEEQ